MVEPQFGLSGSSASWIIWAMASLQARQRFLVSGLLMVAGFIALQPCYAVAGELVPAGGSKLVLVIESFGRNIAPWDAFTPAFKGALAEQSRVPIEFHEPALETAKENTTEAEGAFAKYLLALHAERKPDLVVPVGAASAQFWWRHRATLFPNVPVLIGGIAKQLLPGLPLETNDAAVAIEFDVRACPDVVLQVLPATPNIMVVMGDSVLERFWVAECERAWQPFTNRVQFVWLNNLPFAEICRRVAVMPPRTVLAYGMFIVDAAGVSLEHMSALDRIHAAASAPMFGLFEEQLGHGIVGGRLISGASIGREAARIARRMLDGEPAGKIPPAVITASEPVFDWHELQRWKISGRQLPPGSIVRFQEASVWHRYHGYIMAVFGVILFQAISIMALLAQRTRRQRAELAARRQRNELLHLGRAQVLGQLSSALAHELNQPLGAILSNAEAAELLLQKENPGLNEIREIVADIRNDDRHASDVICRMRALLSRHEMEIRPLSANELIADCVALSRTDFAERKISFHSEVKPKTPRVWGDRVHLEQVLLNLIVNAMDAMRDTPVEQRRVWIRVAPSNPGRVVFSVEDSGHGIQPDQLERVFDSFHTTKPNGLGLGLSISRTIIEAHQGRIWAENNLDGGMTFRFTLPAEAGDNDHTPGTNRN